MGSKYVKGRSIDLSEVYKESSPSSPLFFILSPGVDPLKDVEALGEALPTPDWHQPCWPSGQNRMDPLSTDTDISPAGMRLGFTIDNGKIHNVSLGQGQEVVAEHAMEVAAAEGHWVILQVGGGSGAHHRAHSPDGNWAHQGTKSCQHPGTLCRVTSLAMAVTLPGLAGCTQRLPLVEPQKESGWGGSEILKVQRVSFAEHPPSGPVAGHTGEAGGASQSRKPPRVPTVHERRASPQPRDAHHPAGAAGQLHQDHQRAADRHACQPARSPRPLHPGTPGATPTLPQLPPRALLGSRYGSSPLRVPQAEHLRGVSAARDTAPGASPCQDILLECPESPSGRDLGVTRAAQGFPTQGSARLPVPFLRLNLELLQLCYE